MQSNALRYQGVGKVIKLLSFMIHQMKLQIQEFLIPTPLITIFKLGNMHK